MLIYMVIVKDHDIFATGACSAALDDHPGRASS
jgi:hypothetical protein